MTADEIRRALECSKPSCACHRVNGTLAHCVVHDDADPSLSIRDGDSAVLLRCATGCDRESIIAALKQRGLWPRETAEREWRDPDVIYRFLDLEGRLVGEKGRIDYVDRETGEMKKRFLWRLPGWTRWKGLGVDENGDQIVMPLFNVADVIRRPDAPVFFVEGEKAVQSLTVRGLVAVCGYAGAGQKVWDEASLALLDSRDVVLWPDNDAEGFSLMGRMLWRFPQARMIRPDLPPKADAYDYFEAGGTVDGIASMASITVAVAPAPSNVVPITRATGVRPFIAS